MKWGKWGAKAPAREKLDEAALVEGLGGEDETARLERELIEYAKKKIVVRMETGADGRKVLVPVEPVSDQKAKRGNPKGDKTK